MKRYFITYELSGKEVFSHDNFRLYLLKTLIDMGCSAITSYHDGCLMFSSTHDFLKIKGIIMKEKFAMYSFFTVGEITLSVNDGFFNTFGKSNGKHVEKFGTLIDDFQGK